LLLFFPNGFSTLYIVSNAGVPDEAEFFTLRLAQSMLSDYLCNLLTSEILLCMGVGLILKLVGTYPEAEDPRND